MNAPFNMSATIIAKSDQLNADDLIGGPRTIKVRSVSGSENPEQPVNVYYEGDNGKPFRPCKTVRRVMVACWGNDASAYAGRAMTLVRDASVSFGGMQVGGIRVSHMSHIDGEQTVVVMKTKGKKAPIKIRPLQAGTDRPPAALSPPPASDEPSTDAGTTGAASTDDPKLAATRKWLDDRLAQIEAITDRADLAAFQTKHEANLGKVKAAFPDMADEFSAAILVRLADMDEQPADAPGDEWRGNPLGGG